MQICVAIIISIFVIVIIIITICVSCFGPMFVLTELCLVPMIFLMLGFVLLAIIMCSVFLSCFRVSCPKGCSSSSCPVFFWVSLL